MQTLKVTPTAPAGDDYQTLKAELIDTGEKAPQKIRERRSTKQPEPVQVQEILDPQTMQMILEFPFNYLANRRGEHWKLTKGESEQLGALTNRVAVKYSPEWLSAFGDEIALATLLGLVLLPRMQIDSLEREKAEQLEKQDAEGQTLENPGDRVESQFAGHGGTRVITSPDGGKGAMGG